MNPVIAVDFSFLPPLNAGLNAVSILFLLAGLYCIKKGRREAHKKAMMGALVCVSLFLIGYILYHFQAGHTEFPREYPIARRIYFAILLPHILLAAALIPMIIILLRAAFRGKFQKHKRLARIVFPIWLFVAITGILIYFMLHQWFLQTAVLSEHSSNRRIPLPAETQESVANGRAIAPKAESTKKTVGSLTFLQTSNTIQTEPGSGAVTLEYVVENTGQKPVHIASIESSCECLEADIDANPIDPGKKATIRGVFDTTKLQSTVDRRITVHVEDQARPIFLSARIEMTPLYEIQPAMTIWKRGEAAKTQAVSFQVLQAKPIRILSVESKRPEVKCELLTEKEGRSYRLELTPDSTETTLLGIVRIETDCDVEAFAKPLAYFSIQ